MLRVFAGKPVQRRRDTRWTRRNRHPGRRRSAKSRRTARAASAPGRTPPARRSPCRRSTRPAAVRPPRNHRATACKYSVWRKMPAILHAGIEREQPIVDALHRDAGCEAPESNTFRLSASFRVVLFGGPWRSRLSGPQGSLSPRRRTGSRPSRASPSRRMHLAGRIRASSASTRRSAYPKSLSAGWP